MPRRSSRSLGPGFRALLVGSAVSNTGDGIRLAALPLLATDLTSSPFLISLVTAAQYLPWATFAPMGGALVDRWDRRRTILVTQLWRALVMGLLALAVVGDMVAIWQICVVAALITVGEILVDPSVFALVPTLVADDDLDTANGRVAGAEMVTNQFAGGPVGAAVYGVAPWLPFLIDGASYAGSTLAFRSLPQRHRASADIGDRSIRREARAGFAFLWGHPVLAPFTAATMAYFVGIATSMSLLVVLVTAELDGSGLAFGVVLAAGALGAAAGSVTAGRTVNAVGRRVTISGAVAVQGCSLVAMATADAVWHLVVVGVLNGVAAGVQRPPAQAIQQRLTPNHLLGRVNVTARVFSRGVIIIGALASGALASASGVRWAFVAAGIVQLLAGAAMWHVLRRLHEED